MVTEMWAVGLTVFASLVGAMGPIFLKKGTKDLDIWKLYKNYNLIFGVFLYGASLLIFIPALKGGEVSVLYPIVALSYVWISILSKYMLGERMNKHKWTGIALILFGILLISASI